MTTAQRIIKYLALGFACVLAFSIIAGIVSAGAGILTGIGVINGSAPEALVDCAQYEKCLSLQINYAEVYIKEGGDEIMIDSSDDNYEIVKGDANLIIKDAKKTSWFGDNSRKITITIPEGLEFDAAGINGRAGRIEIEKIKTKELDLSLGAGEVNIEAAMTGKSKIDVGAGAVNLDLLMPASEYAIKADNGLGGIEFNGADVSSGMVVQGGENKIDVDNGVGKITIKTVKE